MLTTLGEWVTTMFRRLAPDPFVIAVLLTAATAALAVAVGFAPDDGVRPGVGERLARVLDAWRAEEGLWQFLGFAMQMCLILVSGHAVASSAPVRRGLTRLAALPRTSRQAVWMVGASACLAALLNWGLGLIVGALLARDVARAMRERGVGVSPALLAAAGYLGLLVWHGGLSGSAPLTMTTPAGAARVLPAEAMARFGDGVPLSATLFSPLNLMVTGGLVVLAPLVMAWMAERDGPRGRRGGDGRAPIASDGEDSRRDDPPAGARPGEDDGAVGAIPRWLERSPVVVWALAAALALGVARYVAVSGAARVGINEINAAMIALGLVLHGSARSYVSAIEDAARGCAGIILQFPLYGGIMAMMVASGLVGLIARSTIDLAGPSGTPIMTFASAAVVNLFVPSGGGQWGIQGPIALRAGVGAGIEPATMIMAVAYGDQLTNMLQPFWALPLLAITGQRARDIVGYTTIVMLVAAGWIALGLAVFG